MNLKKKEKKERKPSINDVFQITMQFRIREIFILLSSSILPDFLQEFPSPTHNPARIFAAFVFCWESN